jgi:hypothetical protein
MEPPHPTVLPECSNTTKRLRKLLPHGFKSLLQFADFFKFVQSSTISYRLPDGYSLGFSRFPLLRLRLSFVAFDSEIVKLMIIQRQIPLQTSLTDGASNMSLESCIGTS